MPLANCSKHFAIFCVFCVCATVCIIYKLVLEHKKFKPAHADNRPVEQKCPMYKEFRQLDFRQPALKHKLCRNVEAYKQYPDGFPMCQLPSSFDEDMLNTVREGSDIAGLLDMRSMKIPMFVYKGSDMISDWIRKTGEWEADLVRWTLRFALKLPRVTFLDMGSNIGVYSLQAAMLGLPVVAVDANIRSLLRLRLSLTAASLNATLVWNFIASDRTLKYLSFPSDCNVGGAGKGRSDLPDTVPVMPLRSERIAELIHTKNAVIKMDIQGGEADFLLMSGRLFTDFSVAAVQMEWAMLSSKETATLTKFFLDRDYRVWKLPELTELDAANSLRWGENDVVWIRKDFVKML